LIIPVGILFCSCSPSKNQSLEDIIYTNYRIEPERTILIVDIDRCNSCSMVNEGFIKSQSVGRKSTLLLLSQSRKKAEVFMKFSEIDYIWDSLRIGEPYLKDRMTFIYEKK
jgi:hypothetical protein